ncbi:MAG: HD domain-containing protein [Tissierellia bacterium]|nr:HD domain-containing protein [Tissierellia bacterium]
MEVFKDLNFVVEIEKMKNVFRMTKVIGTDRRENDAEHSYHIAIMSMILEKYSKNKIDVNRVIQMLLVHDLVEIYAGDTYAYDVKANQDKALREQEAMKKIKTQLSLDTADHIENLWLEFEARESDEAKYANAMDRLQPIFSNLYDGNGGTWLENKVTYSQIIKRIEPIKDFNDDVYNFIHTEILRAVEKGYIIGNH